jgi:hypothetical protein
LRQDARPFLTPWRLSHRGALEATEGEEPASRHLKVRQRLRGHLPGEHNEQHERSFEGFDEARASKAD